jgi:AbrB family looped-hinge helix DNA binding protein
MYTFQEGAMGSANAHQAKISAKGWVVIPATLRRRHGLTPGTMVRFEEIDGKIVISKSKAGYQKVRGSLPAQPSLTQELLSERTKDCRREEAKIRAG